MCSAVRELLLCCVSFAARGLYPRMWATPRLYYWIRIEVRKSKFLASLKSSGTVSVSWCPNFSLWKCSAALQCSCLWNCESKTDTLMPSVYSACNWRQNIGLGMITSQQKTTKRDSIRSQYRSLHTDNRYSIITR
jgi:hypothetical protein